MIDTPNMCKRFTNEKSPPFWVAIFYLLEMICFFQ